MSVTRNSCLFIQLLSISCIVVGISTTVTAQTIDTNAQTALDRMAQEVAEASQQAPRWDGPISGPAALSEITVAVVCEDLRNGGVLGVARGVEEAAEVLGWKVRVFDAHGTPEGRADVLSAALAMKPDGVILAGSDAANLAPLLARFAKKEIPIVGWHVGPVAGRLSSSSVAINVSTDPMEVARITAMAAIVESRGQAGVVIFTDDNFKIATLKSDAMADVIRRCEECTLLELLHLPISQSASKVPQATHELLQRYGKRWTHALAINDIYFDYAIPELTKSARDIHLYSAGDGSQAAFLRIQAGTFQYGTVAEPLNLQGWQLMDELNRLLNGQSVSGYITPVHLVTPDNIAFDGGSHMMFDPDNGYREIYRQIWKR